MPGLHAALRPRQASVAFRAGDFGVGRISRADLMATFWGVPALPRPRPDVARVQIGLALPHRVAAAPASGRRRVDIKKARPTRAGLPFGPYAEASLGPVWEQVN